MVVRLERAARATPARPAGLRLRDRPASELVGAMLRDIRRDEHGDHWLHVIGKGGKFGKVALPSLARTALDQYLVQRGLTGHADTLEPGDAARCKSRRGRRGH